MTDDLVKRLRACIHTSVDPLALTNEAADRIEQLEAALQYYADENYNGFNGNGAYARAALEREKANDAAT